MSYQFRTREPVSTAIRRIGAESMEHAARQFKAGGRLKSIHAARKDIKKCRALLKLVRDGLGKRTYQKRNAALRAAAKQLAAARDAHVRVQVFDALLHGQMARGGREFSTIRAFLKKRCKKEAKALRNGDSAKIARRILRKERGKLGSLKIKLGGWGAMSRALAKTYGAGRKGRELAQSKPAPERFHEWRKDVKQLWYYVQLLKPACHEQLGALASALEALGETLGEDHDLHLLLEELRQAPKQKKIFAKAGQVAAVIESRQRRLRQSALKQGGRIYSEEPEQFVRQLHRCWEAWQGKAGKSRTPSSG